MADTTALKNRIRAAIKANDNQEITGPVLQQALLDMVDELNGATETEASQRQSDDSTLQQGINTERQQRQDADTALGQRITTEIQQERQRAEDAFDDLDMIDAAGSQVAPNAIDLTLRKNDGSEEDPEWRTLCHLLIPSVTTERAGLMSVAMRNLLYNLRNAGYAFGGTAVTATNPGVPSGNCFYIVRGAGTYTHFKNADDESIILENDGIYVFMYESVENHYWEYNLIIGIDDKPTPESDSLAKSGGIFEVCANIIYLDYWGASSAEMDNLPAGHYFYNTYNKKIQQTTGIAGSYRTCPFSNSAIYFYNNIPLVYNNVDASNPLIKSKEIYAPASRKGFYISADGSLTKYATLSISELLYIPTNNCTIKGLWNGGNIGWSVVFFDDNLNFLGGFNISSFDTYNGFVWDVNAVEVPLNAKYMVLQSSTAIGIWISSSMSLLTGLDYYEQKEKIGTKVNTLYDFVQDIIVNYDQNGFISASNGNIVSYEDAKATSDYYPINPFITYIVSGKSSSSVALFAYYDENKTKISTYVGEAIKRNIDDLLVRPANAKYIRFSTWPINQNTEYYGAVCQRRFNLNRSEYFTKKWCVLGDSLTARNSATPKLYHDYISEETGISIQNLGQGGTGYARGMDSEHAFYQRINQIDSDVDVVTIFGSFNDLGIWGDDGLPLGNIDDNEPNSICGCINKTISDIQTRFPLINVGVITPTPWSSTQPTIDGNSRGEIYVKALIDICRLHSIPILDLYHNSCLRPWNAAAVAVTYTRDGTYTASTSSTPNAIQVSESLLPYVKVHGVPEASVGDWVLMTGGGTHPDENGHKIIASKISNFLKSLLIVK